MDIPTDVAKSTPSTQYTKGWRVVWRLEVIITHKPIPHVGNRIAKSFELAIINYATPTLPHRPPSLDTVVGTDAYTTSINIFTPRSIVGPEDVLNVAVSARPADPGTSLKKVTIVLERVMGWLEDRKTLFKRSGSPEDAVACRAIVSTSQAVSSNSTTFQLTLPKRGGTWDTGETCITKFVSIAFQVRVKVHLKAGRTVREFQCPPVPITVSSVTSAERTRAESSIRAERHRSTDRRRTSRRSMYMQAGATDISEVSLHVPRKRSPSPAVVMASPPVGLKPILLSPEQPCQQPPAQSISFIFPSAPPHSNPIFDTSLSLSENVGSPNSDTLADPTPDSWSTAQEHRRVSTSESEGDALHMFQRGQKRPETFDESFDPRPTLPSLDTLGIGLPKIQRSAYARPATAPAHISCALTHPAFSRPSTSFGQRLRRATPPPALPLEQSSAPNNQNEPLISPHTFAFTLQGE